MSHPAEFWCARRLVVTVEGPQGKSVVPLARPFARIGRESRSDIVLNSPWVARRSLYLHATDEGVYCFYLQPEERQGQRLGFWLAPHEPLLVGPYRVSAALEGEEPAAAPALVPLDDWGSAAAPYPVLQVYSGGKLRDKRKFRARLNLIGRRHECALQVKGGHVSSFHGCLYWHNSRLWYVDLISSNGTLKNREPFDFGRVRVGDQLEIGEFALQFQRLSRSGSQRPSAPATIPTEQQPAHMLPADFEDELPIDLDAAAVAATFERPGQVDDALESSPVIPLDMPEDELLADPALAQPTLVEPAAHLPATSTELSVPAPVEQTRHELAALQQRVAELTQLTTQVGQQTARQVVAKTRQTLEHERLRIQHELARRAAELSREKQALDEQWQNASRELATQVQELKSEATLLARQRQDMEQARLVWEAQRGELERQLRTYAQQLAFLQQGAAAGLPPPAGASDSEVATALVLAAAEARGGALTARSHVVEARVADADIAADHANGAARRGLPENGAAASLPPPDAAQLARVGGERFLEGSMAPVPAAAPASNGNHAEPDAPRLPIRGRRSDKSKQVFDQVTDRMVELEEGRRQTMLWLGVGGGIAVAVLSAAIIVAAVLLR